MLCRHTYLDIFKFQKNRCYFIYLDAVICLIDQFVYHGCQLKIVLTLPLKLPFQRLCNTSALVFETQFDCLSSLQFPYTFKVSTTRYKSPLEFDYFSVQYIDKFQKNEDLSVAVSIVYTFLCVLISF